jgi:RHS repeat-associated protein
VPATNTFTPTATSSVTPPPGGSLITYYYDPLYRLTAANYTNGTYFHYTYDAVGNRLSEVSNAGTVNYAYDIANRLTSVGGVTYTWDNNGNLLSDGAWTYSYSHANRLIRAEPAGAPRTYFSYGYNGLGDRLSQAYTNQDLPSVSSVTEYVADLNAGLTQVLSETTTTNGFPSTSTYLYGVGRIGEEQTAGWQYHLGDPLGSVRQLTNPAAAVTLTSSYEPFGDTLLSAGSAATTMQFTGEQRDGTGLTYLRARYLSTAAGSFVERDVWPGNVYSPLSLMRWIYVRANPVNLTDPSGLVTEGEADQANAIVDYLFTTYGVRIHRDWGFVRLPDSLYGYEIAAPCVWRPGNWRSLSELALTRDGIDLASRAMGGPNKFRSAMEGTIRITRWAWPYSSAFSPPGALSVFGDIVLTDYHFSYFLDSYARYGVIHEIGHVWDYKSSGLLSKRMAEELGTYYCVPGPRGGTICRFEIGAGSEPPPGDVNRPYAGKSILEDWAEAFATYAYPDYYEEISGRPLGPIRRDYVRRKIDEIP